jgi:hypothetical protein
LIQSAFLKNLNNGKKALTLAFSVTPNYPSPRV